MSGKKCIIAEVREIGLAYVGLSHLTGREMTTGQKRYAFGTILQLNGVDVTEQILLGGRSPRSAKKESTSCPLNLRSEN